MSRGAVDAAAAHERVARGAFWGTVRAVEQEAAAEVGACLWCSTPHDFAGELCEACGLPPFVLAWARDLVHQAREEADAAAEWVKLYPHRLPRGGTVEHCIAEVQDRATELDAVSVATLHLVVGELAAVRCRLVTTHGQRVGERIRFLRMLCGTYPAPVHAPPRVA